MLNNKLLDKTGVAFHYNLCISRNTRYRVAKVREALPLAKYPCRLPANDGIFAPAAPVILPNFAG